MIETRYLFVIIFLLFIISFSISYFLQKLLIKFSRKNNVFDTVNDRKLKKTPKSRLGGIGVFSSILLTLILLILLFPMAPLQKTTSNICTIISKINNPTDAFSFLRDLLTETELKEFAQRLEIATMLSDKVQYKTIEEKTGASSTTIARVKKYLDGKWG